ncbi:MAG: peptidoglycan DD-metalloendopeptidase family protein [Candidatus Nanopelagicales bacterium]|jgi:murein DD-endopeptidase MepM/ murein hydrolase activator NlpD|nr:peptidoglycan DD-metalloendopeptidase family protein [Candidatus Nanopelagicales bacterium]
MRARRAIGVALSAVLTLGVVALGPASADTEEDKAKVDAAVAAAGDDLESANAEVREAIAKLQEAKEKLPAARAALAEARAAAQVAEEADLAAQAELEQATAAAIRAEQERAEVEFQIQDLQSRVGNLAREVYQNGAFADFDLLITAASPTELADRAAALAAVSRVNNQTLARMGEIRAELALKEARLEVLRMKVDEKRQLAAIALKEANIARDRAAAAKAQVDLLVAQRATALNVASANRAKVLKQYKTVQAEQQRIAALLAKEAAAEAARLAAGTAPRFVPTEGDGFIWPLQGVPVGQGVGPRIHPVYGYRSCHTGVDLGAPSGTPIRATAAGIVLINASGGPYGNHTLVSHGNGLFSMYAHQSRFGAEEGQELKQGDVVGYVGSTGYSTGPHLHFEIHVGGKPYDPMGWFGGEKVPVSC